MRKLLLLLITLFTLAYPALVYLGLNRLSPALFAGVFLVAAIARYLFVPNQGGSASLWVLLAVAAYSVLVAVVNTAWVLRLYPVIVSWGMAAVFALSLRHGEGSLIETLARAAGKTITPNARRYTRKLTLIWAVLLVINGLAALWLAVFASWQAWALYCGLIAYLLMGAFFVAELIYRQYYIAKVGR